MTNHAHIVFCRLGTVKPERVLGHLKRYTIKKIVSAIIENPQESRKEWLLNLFQKSSTEQFKGERISFLAARQSTY